MLLTHRSVAIVNLTKPYPSLLLRFSAMHPIALIDIKLVARQEHPAKFADKFNGGKYVFYVFITHEIIEVESRESHPEKFVALIKRLFVPS